MPSTMSATLSQRSSRFIVTLGKSLPTELAVGEVGEQLHTDLVVAAGPLRPADEGPNPPQW